MISLNRAVGVVGGAEAGEHPHRPQLRAVHRRVEPRVYGYSPGNAVVAVHRIDGNARHRLEKDITVRHGFQYASYLAHPD